MDNCPDDPNPDQQDTDSDGTGDRCDVCPLDPLDELSDVFTTSGLDLPALLQRYKAYLTRLKAKGINPWKDQPRRSDMHLTEDVGHFHLYAWLKEAVEDLYKMDIIKNK